MTARFGLTVLMAASLTVFAGSVRADVTLVYDVDVERPEKIEKKVTWHLAETRLALVTGGDKAARVFYSVKDSTLTLVDDTKKQYVVLTPENVATLSTMLAGMASQMEQVLAGLSPEQREKVAGEMKKRGLEPGEKKSLTIEVLPMSETKNMHGFTCRKNEVLANGAKAAEVWTTALGPNTVTAAEWAPVNAMVTSLHQVFDAVSGLTKAFDVEMSLPSSLGRGLEGVPVYVKDLEGDAVKGEMTLTSLKRGEIDDDVFEIDDDYKKQELTPAEH
ncbi:MAG TPA: hypothetical protein VF720_00740 [Candidatus Eisenbacteria bacterium]